MHCNSTSLMMDCKMIMIPWFYPVVNYKMQRTITATTKLDWSHLFSVWLLELKRFSSWCLPAHMLAPFAARKYMDSWVDNASCLALTDTRWSIPSHYEIVYGHPCVYIWRLLLCFCLWLRSSAPQVLGTPAVSLLHINCQCVGKRLNTKERRHERERKGQKKSIATPGVTAAVTAFKSEGSHFYPELFSFLFSSEFEYYSNANSRSVHKAVVM